MAIIDTKKADVSEDQSNKLVSTIVLKIIKVEIVPCSITC